MNCTSHGNCGLQFPLMACLNGLAGLWRRPLDNALRRRLSLHPSHRSSTLSQRRRAASRDERCAEGLPGHSHTLHPTERGCPRRPLTEGAVILHPHARAASLRLLHDFSETLLIALHSFRHSRPPFDVALAVRCALFFALSCPRRLPSRRP
ncbi:hypothetical protein BU26DRAFT_126809 [Trematosphaeria pertusa]|uniref:Uncharacterized protein n=1 Tax=Trematosphaeria pertusa TaxID=390896 RepID=A0A6A6HYM3_9PLEO|nr:uncharacterized protein BU26DRAFT_126809 [Trematosphaeria pertusa]KAF2243127.1 hypothetical protein BU26DRAFT_126809 [Trematosphaeria pertusa]